MKNLYPFFITLLFYSSVYSQEISKLDSLFIKLNTQTNDTLKVDLLNEIAWEYRAVNPDSTIKYCKQSYRLAKQLNYPEGIINANAYTGVAYRNLGKHDIALGIYQKNLELAKSFGLEQKVAFSLINIANIHTLKMNYAQAIDEVYQAVKIGEKIKDTKIIAYAYINLARIYTKSKQYQKAIEAHKKAYDIRKAENDIVNFSASLIGMGDCYYMLKDYDKALDYFTKSLNNYKKLNFTITIGSISYKIGSIFTEKKQYQKAEKYYFDALKYYTNGNYEYGKIRVNSLLGTLYFKQKKYHKAEKILLKSYQNAIKQKIIPVQNNNAKLLSEIYFKTGKPAKAYQYLLTHKQLSDSIIQMEKTDELVAFELKHLFKQQQAEQRAKQKEKDILTKQHAKRQRIINYTLTAGLIGLLIFVIVMFSNIKLIRKQNKKLLEKNAEIEQQNEEIKSQAEEIAAQSQILKYANAELEKLSIVASQTGNAIMITDKDGNFEWVNEAFTNLFGYTLSELRKKVGNNIIGKNTNDDVKEHFKRLIKTKEKVEYEMELPARQGGNIWVHTTLTPILNSKGQIKKIVIIDSDITSLKKAKKELQRKHDDIKASIRYAQKIQRAILPLQSAVDDLFNNFILFLPKHIVSGDFYWHSEVKDSIFFDAGKTYRFFAVVDCTGHGVPGAFMSMIGTQMLNEIVNEKEIYDTAEILELLNKNINRALKQDSSDNSDGMDVCLCRFEEHENEQTKVIFSGAKRPLFVYRKKTKELTRIKGDRKSIGGKYDNGLIFTKNELILDKGDLVYFSSDGYVDQNNADIRKFGTSQLIDLLTEIAEKELAEQKQILKSKLRAWQGAEIQRDDITVAAIKI